MLTWKSLNSQVQNEICKYLQDRVKNRITINARDSETSKIISLECDYSIETVKALRNNKEVVSRASTLNNCQVDISSSDLIDEIVNRNANASYSKIISCSLRKESDTISECRSAFKLSTGNDRVTSVVESSNVDSLGTEEATRDKRRRAQYESEEVEKRVEKLISRVHTCDVSVLIVQS